MAAACGGAEAPPPASGEHDGHVTVAPSAGCSAPSDPVVVVAGHETFERTCVGIPAGRAFTLRLRNVDTERHNVSIFDRDPVGADAARARVIHQGEFVVSGSLDARVGPVAAGAYYFRCDAHPETMTGTMRAA